MDEEMKREINGIKSRLDGFGRQFIEINKRFDGIDKRFEGVDKRFDGVDKRFDDVDKRFDVIEKDLAETKSAVQRVAINMVKIKAEMRDFKDTVEAVMKNEFYRIRTLITDFLPLVEAARDDRSRNEKAHQRHDDRFDDHERRLTRLETRAS